MVLTIPGSPSSKLGHPTTVAFHGKERARLPDGILFDGHDTNDPLTQRCQTSIQGPNVDGTLRPPKTEVGSWMSRVPEVNGSMGYFDSPTYKWGIPWGYNPHTNLHGPPNTYIFRGFYGK